jgi:hypothetical protein
MEAIGSGDSTDDVDRVVWDDGDRELTAAALLGLLGRLERTITDEQLLFRECELDCAYRLAESDLEFEIRASGPGRAADLRSAVLAHVTAAHDLVGLARTVEAAKELRGGIRLRQEADVAKFNAE